MKLIPSLRKSMLLFAIINLSDLVTLPLNLHENYGQLLILNIEDTTLISLSTFQLIVWMIALLKYHTGEHPTSEVYHSSAVKCDVEISEYQIKKILSPRCVKRTSTWWGGLLSWLFKKCCVELAFVVTHLINYSINEGQIPDIWRTAIVTPVPKLTQPAACNDYRPISVTPILSRITDRFLLTDGYVLQFLRNFFSISMLRILLYTGLGQWQ